MGRLHLQEEGGGCILVSLLVRMVRYRLLWVAILGLTSFLYLVVSVSKIRPVVVPIYPPPELEQSTACGSSSPRLHQPDEPESGPWIYVITPTYPRREQIAELTRLGQTLLLVKRLHWVVAEDSPVCSPLVAALLSRLGLPYTHLASPQPLLYKQANLKYNPRGVSSRRAGLSWVMQHVHTPGVVYFADDDNTYDIRLFKEIATTQRISMFPVGFIGSQGVSSPIVKAGRVIGFTDDWFAQRKWPVDMAGFAVNLNFLRLRNPKADTAMPYKAGYEEDIFIQNLRITLDDIEPLGDDCTEVLVWHTKTVKEKMSTLRVENLEQETSLSSLLRHLVDTGLAAAGGEGAKSMKACYGGKQCRT